MSERISLEEQHQAFRESLMAITSQLKVVMPPESWRLYKEYVWAGEYGLALGAAYSALSQLDDPPEELVQSVRAVFVAMDVKWP